MSDGQQVVDLMRPLRSAVDGLAPNIIDVFVSDPPSAVEGGIPRRIVRHHKYVNVGILSRELQEKILAAIHFNSSGFLRLGGFALTREIL